MRIIQLIPCDMCQTMTTSAHMAQIRHSETHNYFVVCGAQCAAIATLILSGRNPDDEIRENLSKVRTARYN